MANPARPGKRITDVLTTQRVNELLRKRNKTYHPEQPLPENPVKVWAVPAAGVSKDRFDAVNIVGPAVSSDTFTDGFDPQQCDLVEVNTALTSGRWGVLEGPIIDTQSARLRILGLAWTKFTLREASDGFVDVVDGELKSTRSGTARIIFPPPGSTLPRTGVGYLLLGGSATGATSGFFELLETMPAGHGNRAWAKILDWSNTTISEDYVYNWGRTIPSILGNYPPGTYGSYTLIEDRKAFCQGECGQLCVTAVSFPANPTFSDATIGQTNYTGSFSPVGGSVNSGSWSASGLPSGWSINSSTGTISGPTSSPGVVGPARDLYVYVSATAAKTGGGTCTLTRRIKIKIKA